MRQTKHKSLPFGETIDVKKVIGKKVLTNDGKKIGKVKAIHIHPTELTVEGIQVDTGMFDVDQYIDKNYLGSLTEEGAVLKVTPLAEFLDHDVYDSLGKKVGNVKAINRSNMTNNVLSITVELEGSDKKIVISADYIAAMGESIMLKEPFDEKGMQEVK
ncbi:MAG: PRC-barrel domain-containing protein [Nanoarchaeota archaeon]|nr:PRC-barrel domain-containing protein [Nanoarchaeota archaeon]